MSAGHGTRFDEVAEGIDRCDRRDSVDFPCSGGFSIFLEWAPSQIGFCGEPGNHADFQAVGVRLGRRGGRPQVMPVRVRVGSDREG